MIYYTLPFYLILSNFSIGVAPCGRWDTDIVDVAPCGRWDTDIVDMDICIRDKNKFNLVLLKQKWKEQ
jgi:hypothetical protein